MAWREVVQRTKAVTHAPERITCLAEAGEGCTPSWATVLLRSYAFLILNVSDSWTSLRTCTSVTLYIMLTYTLTCTYKIFLPTVEFLGKQWGRKLGYTGGLLYLYAIRARRNSASSFREQNYRNYEAWHPIFLGNVHRRVEKDEIHGIKNCIVKGTNWDEKVIVV